MKIVKVIITPAQGAVASTLENAQIMIGSTLCGSATITSGTSIEVMCTSDSGESLITGNSVRIISQSALGISLAHIEVYGFAVTQTEADLKRDLKVKEGKHCPGTFDEFTNVATLKTCTDNVRAYEQKLTLDVTRPAHNGYWIKNNQ